ncbi:glycoside hydrolase family 43 protein [Sphingomonas carotinifaciens]|uniref:glycoside hydrolase family 43 protein n=1 Tax=Sphingomonas carotinifaciens TaxID=1166323 RepID=UPI000DD5A8E0|nr:glycoside hydrolase family 43 protein [Sphingomonas carotinifaciens]
MLDRRTFCGRVALAATLPAFAQRAAAAPAGGGYAFSYFRNADNGGAGMRLAISEDGYRYRAVRDGAPILVPIVGENKLMRDPCIARDPQTGLYHMVWTTSWTGVTIGHASSRDLIHWSEQQAVPVMAAFPDTRNSWAPELVWDARARHFVIVWASTVGKAGDEGDHRLYATTTRDFRRFTPTQLFYDPGFSVIDATFLERDGRMLMFVKDERRDPLRKVIQWCEVSLSPPRFGPLSAPITPAWSEGPTAVVVDGEIVLFFDRYTEKHYDAIASRDGRTWRDVSDRIAMPAGANHGTIIPIGAERLKALAALG